MDAKQVWISITIGTASLMRFSPFNGSAIEESLLVYEPDVDVQFGSFLKASAVIIRFNKIHEIITVVFERVTAAKGKNNFGEVVEFRIFVGCINQRVRDSQCISFVLQSI